MKVQANYADEQQAQEDARDIWISSRAKELMTEMDDNWMGDALHHLDPGLQSELVIAVMRAAGDVDLDQEMASSIIEQLYRQLESYALDCAEKEAGEL